MKTLNITGTPEILDDYGSFKVFKCTTTSEIPKLYNTGWNVFEFKENVKFEFNNIPLNDDKKRENPNYIWEESEIKVFGSKNTILWGTYTKTTDKATGEITQRFTYN